MTLDDLYDCGLYLQAWRILEKEGDVRRLEGAKRVFAGRLVRHIGAPRLSDALLITAWRRDPADPNAFASYAHSVFTRRGAFHAWKLLRRAPVLRDPSPRVLSDLALLRAHIAATFRDFDLANAMLRDAESQDPDRPWLAVMRATVLEREDRVDEALAEARRSLEADPWYRPGVQSVAELLLTLRRDEEALELLRGAHRRIESLPLAWELATLEMELGLHADARDTFERAVQFAPVLEKEVKKALDACRADAAYLSGDVDRAAELAHGLEEPHYREFGNRLRSGARERVLLPVPFVRQNRATCVPATVASLTEFWGKPTAHLEIAEEICYDGTPHHSQRVWAEENGWFVREFTVNWESATSLLRGGVPFALTTAHPLGGHLQSVMGFDAARRTLLVRDPGSRWWREYDADGLFEAQRSTGPRGMVIALRSVDGPFPDAEAFDRFHELHRALARHDRPSAERAAAAIPSGTRLALHARRTIAAYDHDVAAIAKTTDDLLAMDPRDPLLLLTKLRTIRDLAGSRDALAFLRSACDAHPIFWREYGEELRDGNAREAKWWLGRALAVHPEDADAVFALAGILWEERRHDEATELYRFATCLEDKREQYALAYFLSARNDEALGFLKRRFEAFGAKSGFPGMTLARAHFESDATREGFEVLDAALRLRPEDPDLLLYAAEAHADVGNADRAKELLARAEPVARRGTWLYVAARIEPTKERWAEVARLEPFNLDAQRSYVEALGPAEGRAHLDDVVGRFPHHYGLQRLRIEGLDDAPAEEALRDFLVTHPDDLWARRERAWRLLMLGRAEESFAIPLPDTDAVSVALRGRILVVLGRRDEARAALRRSIELDVDHEPAIRWMLDLEPDLREFVAFLRGELLRQVPLGDGLLAYGELAKDRAALREMADRWPMRAAAWVAEIRGLVALDDAPEARRRAEEACRRFPLEARVRHAAGQAYRGTDEEVRLLREAARLAPGDAAVAIALSEALERRGEFDESRRVLSQAAARHPRNPYVLGSLADLEYKAGERETAIARLERALRADSSYLWGWRTLEQWAPEAGLPLARELGDPLAVARLSKDLDERLRALDEGLRIDPGSLAALDLKAVLLAEAGRHADAQAVCASSDSPMMRTRGAWVIAMKDDLDGAIEDLERVVKEHDRYAPAWFLLSQWYRDRDDRDDYLRAASKAVDLEPQEARYRYELAEARLRKGGRFGAKSDLARAIELDPTYGNAALYLFDLEFEDDELDKAERALSCLKTHHPDAPPVRLREIRLALRRSEYDLAEARLRDFAFLSGEDIRGTLDDAVDAFAKSGVSSRADAVLLEAVDSAGAHPWVAWVWAARRGAWGTWGEVRRKLASLASRGRKEMWSLAAAAYLESLGNVEGAWRVRWFLWKHEAAVRRHVHSWGSAGFALYACGLRRRAIRWLSDWKSRKDARPWMLSNLHMALLDVGEDAEASRVARAALELEPDGTALSFRLWAALDDACGGDADSARGRLRGVGVGDLTDDLRELFHLARGVVLAREGKFDEAAHQLRVGESHAQGVRGPAWRRAVRRAWRAAGRARGGFIGWWWRLRFF